MDSCNSCKKPDMKAQNQLEESNNCPYRMSDGRNFTDYRTRCTIDYQRKVNNAFKSSYDERQYLIHNATNMMNNNMKEAIEINKCSGCFPKNVAGTMLPEKNMVQCNDKTCNFYTQDVNGLGTGRNYNF